MREEHFAVVLAIPKAIRDKFDKQVLHITSKRFLFFDGKLNLGDMVSVTRLILGKGNHFRAQLRDEFRPWRWERRIVLSSL
jgi:hypothetical protein